MAFTEVPHSGAIPIRLPSRLRRIAIELAGFGAIGAIAFVVDVGGFNLLRATLLSDHVITAKVLSVSAAVIVAWIGHRYVTYRGRRKDRVVREAALFVVANVGGLAIAAGCLAISHYALGLTGALADNLSGNVIGVGLGTLFRFLAYRLLVFRAPIGDPA